MCNVFECAKNTYRNKFIINEVPTKKLKNMHGHTFFLKASERAHQDLQNSAKRV